MSLYEINNRFWEWAEMNPISANACCLFGAVVQCLNRGGWPRELAIPLSKLLAMTHLSRPALYRARSELVQAGLLQVQESGSRKASVYGLTLRSPAWLEGEEGEAADMSRKTYREAAPGAPSAGVDMSCKIYREAAAEASSASADMLRETYREAVAEAPSQASQDMPQDASRGVSQEQSQEASQEPSQNGGQKWELIKNKTKTKTKTKTLSPAARQRFGEFWDLYPKKSGRSEAERVWADTVGEDEELYLTVMEALGRQVFWEQWQRDGGRFIPYPARWLEQRLWEDQAVCLPRMPSKYDRVRINDFSESADTGPPKKPSKYDNVKIN
ncbi:MAG: hypothetical protein IJH45_03250 [Firmicutes bacterium]|nr:hypothetical protein [Bacillota bacterium]